MLAMFNSVSFNLRMETNQTFKYAIAFANRSALRSFVQELLTMGLDFSVTRYSTGKFETRVAFDYHFTVLRATLVLTGAIDGETFVECSPK